MGEYCQIESKLLQLNPKAQGYAFSLEAGYPFILKPELVLEPQAQLIYQKLKIGRHKDEVSIISYSGEDSVRGSMGVRLSKSDELRNQGEMNIALTGRIWEEFKGKTRTTFRNLQGNYPTHFTNDLAGPWVDLGVEGTLQLNQRLSFYMNGNYERGFHSRYAIGGSIGMRVNW